VQEALPPSFEVLFLPPSTSGFSAGLPSSSPLSLIAEPQESHVPSESASVCEQIKEPMISHDANESTIMSKPRITNKALTDMCFFEQFKAKPPNH
jgi:hypothetical protein